MCLKKGADTITTINHVIGMKNEIQFLKVVPDIYSVPLSDFSYFVYDDNKSRETVKGTFSDNHCPVIVYNSNQQIKGNDFMYKGLTLDLKVNGRRYERPFFELFYKDGKYTYQKAKDSHIIVAIMAKDSMIYSFPASLIEMIVNHNSQGLPLPQDFYYKGTDFYKFDEITDLKNKGKVGFAISAEILQVCLRSYLSYHCGNSDMRYLLMQCKPYHDKDNNYIEN